MRVVITGEVTDENKKPHRISLFTDDLDKMILEKAKKQGIKGYEGRAWTHFDEQIISVSVED